jgi:hypothetical protein
MMDQRDREAIEELFQKIAEVERRSGPRDAEAEAFIRAKIVQHPAAPYYMAQTIVVQEQALEMAQARIRELEESRQTTGGGFLSGIFGGAAETRSQSSTRVPTSSDRGLARYQRGRGGGFLAGAAQTAMGVAGGVLLGNMIAGMFSGEEAAAAEPDPATGEPDAGFEGAEEGGSMDDAAGGDFSMDGDLF